MAENNRYAYTAASHQCPVDSRNYADHRAGYLAIDGILDPIPNFMRQEHDFYMEFADKYRQHSRDCATSSDAWKKTACECDEKQHVFERDYCTSYRKGDIMCRSYETCRNINEAEWHTANETGFEEVANLKNQWKALKLLECYSEMIRDEIQIFRIAHEKKPLMYRIWISIANHCQQRSLVSLPRTNLAMHLGPANFWTVSVVIILM